MGSTAMHICLTKNIINKLNIEKNKNYTIADINKIYIGSVLPDFFRVHKQTKDNSHYIINIEDKKYKNKNIRVPDIYSFINKYKKEILTNNYLLGELIHLVSDRIWYSEYIPKYINNIFLEKDKIYDKKVKKTINFSKFKEKIYNDYSSINEYLIMKNKIDLDQILKYEENKDICKEIIKNIKQNYNDEILDSKDIKNYNNVFSKKLNYINIKDINEWIKKSEKEIFEFINIIKNIEKTDKEGIKNNMKIILGLGNVGKEYDNTRHNVGFIIIDELIKKYNIENVKKMKKTIAYEGKINGQKIVLAKPTTFMNLSSAAIVELKNWYKIENKDLIVIYDDIDLEFENIKYKNVGSAGTHNGMKDILSNLKTNELSRIRIGIENRRGLPIELKDYVLSNFTKQELNKLKTDVFAKIDEKIIEFLDK